MPVTLSPDHNPDLHLIPQLIAPDTDKLEHIMSLFIEKGYREADINLGCPFPMLARRHNGSGMLPYPEEVKALLSEAIDRHPDIRFSVKLRLGWEQAEECLALLPLFNELPLAHIILHPRLGKQQYKGEVDLEGFEAFYKECTHPLFYNGDLHTAERYPFYHHTVPPIGRYRHRPWATRQSCPGAGIQARNPDFFR